MISDKLHSYLLVDLVRRCVRVENGRLNAIEDLYCNKNNNNERILSIELTFLSLQW